MIYEEWRNELFGQPSDIDPVSHEHSSEFYAVEPARAFDYVERYCTASVVSIGNDQTDGRIGFMCYMFWDIFILYPGNASPLMQAAAISVMRTALDSRNDNCLASAIHGLGHWTIDVPEAAMILNQWLRRPTTRNTQIVHYAQTAISGMIL